MARKTLSTAALAACTLILSSMTFAEESPAFAARFAALQEHALHAAAEHADASPSATESQTVQASVESDQRTDI